MLRRRIANPTFPPQKSRRRRARGARFAHSFAPACRVERAVPLRNTESRRFRTYQPVTFSLLETPSETISKSSHRLRRESFTVNASLSEHKICIFSLVLIISHRSTGREQEKSRSPASSRYVPLHIMIDHGAPPRFRRQ